MADIRDDLAGIPEALRRKYDQYTSLKAQPDENLGDMAVQTAAGFIPGVGQAMALRDMKRSWDEGDKTGLALSAASMLPLGNLVKGLRNSSPIQKIMGGDLAKHAPLEDMAAGEARLSAGETPTKVWREHGVERGPENHQPTKWEIDDSKARVNSHDSLGVTLFHRDTNPGSTASNYSGRAEGVFHHPDLYKNYPDLKDYTVHMQVDPSLSHAEASFYPGEKAIYAQGPSHETLRTSMLHEFDHAVANIQGFDPGANYKDIKEAMIAHLRDTGRVIPKDIDEQAYRIYRKNMGEGSAWGTERRANMSATEKSRIPPSQTHREAAMVAPYEYMIPYDRLPGSK